LQKKRNFEFGENPNYSSASVFAAHMIFWISFYFTAKDVCRMILASHGLRRKQHSKQIAVSANGMKARTSIFDNFT